MNSLGEELENRILLCMMVVIDCFHSGIAGKDELKNKIGEQSAHSDLVFFKL